MIETAVVIPAVVDSGVLRVAGWGSRISTAGNVTCETLPGKPTGAGNVLSGASASTALAAGDSCAVDAFFAKTGNPLLADFLLFPMGRFVTHSALDNGMGPAAADVGGVVEELCAAASLEANPRVPPCTINCGEVAAANGNVERIFGMASDMAFTGMASALFQMPRQGLMHDGSHVKLHG